MHAQHSKDGWQFADLSKPLEQDVDLRLLTDRDPEALEVYRHSSAHLLATAVLELFPETKLGHGPPTDSGFFYDFYRPTTFTPEDLEKIEKRMGEVAARDEKFEREFIPRNEGLARFRSEGDFMKVHFIEQFTRPGEPISIYRNGKFVDFLPRPACSIHRQDQGIQAHQHRRRILAGRRKEPAAPAHLRYVLFQ